MERTGRHADKQWSAPNVLFPRELPAQFIVWSRLPPGMAGRSAAVQPSRHSSTSQPHLPEPSARCPYRQARGNGLWIGLPGDRCGCQDVDPMHAVLRRACRCCRPLPCMPVRAASDNSWFGGFNGASNASSSVPDEWISWLRSIGRFGLLGVQ